MTQPPSVGTGVVDDPTTPGSGRYSTKAVLALILAIVSFVFVAVPILNWVIGVPAVILGHLAVREIRAVHDRGHEIAVAGLVIGYLSVCIALVIVIGSAASVAASTPPGPNRDACVTSTEPTDRQVQACIDSYGE